MRLLCDHNVARNTYKRSNNRTATVTTVAEELSPEASDEAIVRFARRNGWVVFTTDDDFFEHAGVCGVLMYSQITDPSPSDVLDAVVAIDEAYESCSEVIETIPGNWL